MANHVHTINSVDVGNRLLPCTCSMCGHKGVLDVGSAIGRIQTIDVGKRVYVLGGVVQVESDFQRDKRLAPDCATGLETADIKGRSKCPVCGDVTCPGIHVRVRDKPYVEHKP